MWYAADAGERLRASGYYGYGEPGAPTPKFDWESFKPRRDAYIKRLNGIYDRNLEREKVENHNGWARIKDAHTVEVTRKDGSTYDMETENIFITVGGRPTIPSENEIPGASLGIDSDGFFDLEHQPKSVAVVGAGYIATELAGIFHALGTETHILIRHDKVLRKFDPDLQITLTDWMEHTGVKVHKKTDVVKVEGATKGGPVTIHTKNGDQIKVDLLLWAIGRHANTEDLGLQNVGIKTNPQNGEIVVDEYQTSSVSNIFAMGDASGEALLTPVAIAAGRRLSNRLFGPEKFKNQKLDYTNIPTVVFS